MASKTDTTPSSGTPREAMLHKRWKAIMAESEIESKGLLHEYGEPTIGISTIGDDKADVSIIIPCYNVGRYLDQAMRSVLANDRYAIEVIAVNDGSTDDTKAILEDIARMDGRVHVIDKENGGYGSAVNAGLDAARGTYVAIMEPDDWVEPHMYDDLADYAAVASHTNGVLPAIVKSSYWRVVNAGTEHEMRLHCSYYKHLPVDEGEMFLLEDAPELVGHHPSIWSALYLREFLNGHHIRMMEEPGAGWVDNPWLYETMCQADSIIYTDRAWYCYREDLPEASSSGDVVALSLRRWHDMMDIIDRLGVTDKGILSSLHVIGFRFLQNAIHNGGWEDDGVMDGINRMFRRMDLSLVPTLSSVPAALRRMAFGANCMESPEMSDDDYHGVLVREFGKTLQADGIGGAVFKVRRTLGI